MSDLTSQSTIPEEYADKLKAARAQRAMQGERRVVTILFCDVTGSTHMAEQLDPEEWAEIMDSAFDFLIAPVYRYEGTVARLMGDAVLAFFGAPIAHEDDPQRAILAALDILHEAQPFIERIRREYGLDFNLRVGVNTGPVVVGEIGSDFRMEYTAMGDAVNLASRMEETAEPGTVQISEHTYKLIAPLFEVEALGEGEVKGKSQPVRTYRVLRPKAAPGRLRGIQGLYAPVIGRQAEVEALQRAVSDLRQGRGGIVSIFGEAGLGKSRLLDETSIDSNNGNPGGPAWMEHRALSYETARPYALFRQHIREMFGVMDEDPPEVVRAKVKECLPGYAQEKQTELALLAEAMLAVKIDESQPNLEGEAVKRELFSAYLNLFARQAEEQPLVMVFDDMHWADPASVDLVVHLLSLCESHPVLFIFAMRPYRRSPGWNLKLAGETDYPHRYTELDLKPLNDSDSQALVDKLLDISQLPSELHRLILRKAEGNPLFVEEVVRALIESGAVVRDQERLCWEAATNVSDIEIPDNIQSLLVARIDRLAADARHTLQLAAVIGRSFYYRVLHAISDMTDALDSQLNALQRVELIREAARMPEIEYVFHHELTRDAAYKSILRRERRNYHRQVGEAIEQLFPDRLEEQFDRLAYHFSEAHEFEQAVKYCELAGEAAAHIYANAEAIEHYTHAIELAHRLDAPGDKLSELYTRRGRLYELQNQFEEALKNYKTLEQLGRERGEPQLELAALIPQATITSIPSDQHGVQSDLDIPDRALALARQLGDPRAESKALWVKIIRAWFVEGKLAEAIEYGEQAVAIARENGLKEELAFALTDLSRPLFNTGEQEAAIKAVEEAQGLWRELGNQPMLADALTSLGSYIGAGGDINGGVEFTKEALEISRRINNLWGQTYALNITGVIYGIAGRIGEALQAYEEAGTLPTAGQQFFAAVNRISHALLLADLGATERAEALITDLSNKTRGIPAAERIAKPYMSGVLAYLKLVEGDIDAAFELIEEAFQLHKQSSFRLTEWDSYLLHGTQVEIALARGEHEWVVERVEELVNLKEYKSIPVLVPALRFHQARALAALEREEEAYLFLGEAREQAEAFGLRMLLWRIYVALAELEGARGDEQAAAVLRKKARDALDFLANSIPNENLRESFLGREVVRAVYSG